VLKEYLMPQFVTTLGLKSESELGLILPHEHIFVDLRPLGTRGHGQSSEGEVVRLMAPELERARAAGVSAIVECTPEGVGRRIDLVVAVSRAADFPVVVPTGIYREPWVPEWARQASEERLRAWMQGELEGFIAGTGVQAGWVKLSAGDDGLTAAETKILRAAGRAARAAGAAIGSHTIRGRVVLEQLDILAEQDFPARRFISIHAQAEADFELNLAVARRGAWISYDGIGWADDDGMYVQRIQAMLAAGYGGQVLLSHDRGWYSPAEPGGGQAKPFTYLSEVFLPKLRAAGVSEEQIRLMTVQNPFRAFARE
jgi:phosphotriesterase-related protein